MGIEALVIGGLASSALGAVGANKAAKAQSAAAAKADATQRYIFDEQVKLTGPAREAGMNALAVQQGALGMGEMPVFGSLGKRQHIRPDGQGGFNVQNDDGVVWQNFADRPSANAFMDDRRVGFETSPGYQFRQDEGMKAIERNAAARGLRMSAGTMKDMARFNQGLASNEFGNWWNRLSGMAGTGQTATSQQIGALQNYGQNVSNNAFAAGNARASGYQNMNNALQGGINNMFNIAGMAGAGMFGQNPTLFGNPIGIGG